MSGDKIIRFPGPAGVPGREAPPTPPAGGLPTPEQALAALQNLSEDQQKALQIVMSGLPFVLVGIQPTPRGADFFTALHGDATDLRNAQPHLAGVIERLYARKHI